MPLFPTVPPTNRYRRQQNFSLSGARFKRIELDQVSWSIYDNANLSIHVTDKCNADCQFCVAHLRYLHEGAEYNKHQIDNLEDYLERLEEVLLSVQGANPSVSITGGEPTVNKRLPAILRTVARIGARKRTLTTNGTGLGIKVENSSDTILDRLIEYQLEHINISRAHYDFNRNSQIMKMEPHLLSDAQLREYVTAAKSAHIRPRLSCVLLKEGISTVEQMMHYLEWADSMGVDNVIFRQLMDFGPQAVGAIPIYCNQNSVSLEPIWEALDLQSRMNLYHSVLGYYYYVEVRQFGHLDVASEMADLNLIEPQLERFSAELGHPCAFELVYHPNGHLCAGWNEDHNIITRRTLS